MPLGLLLPLLTPLATELVKWLMEKMVVHVPPVAVPLIGTSLATAASVLAPLAGVNLDVTPLEGAELGLAGTGVHQMQKLFRDWFAADTK